ncbi:MAG: hypothetical protein LIP06_06665 [Tannerellaceae bacterium]|nr:hypothetical protein [Tannerellaceae bacterium]
MKEIDSTFTEEDIMKSIQAVDPAQKNDKQQYWNQLIRDLQKYFLWRDVEKGTYRFRPYAENYCKGAAELLEETLKPTEIERHFKFMLNTFQPEFFQEWYENTFLLYTSKLDSQIAALDCQVGRAVAEFREIVASDREYDIERLRNMLDTLTGLREKTSQMNYAFSSSHDITRKLRGYQNSGGENIYYKEANQVIIYFNDLRKNLRIINGKIDMLKPKLNEFIRDINRQDFYKKYKLFLNYLLTESQHVKGEVTLPPTIPPKTIRAEEVMQFTIVKEQWEEGKKLPGRNKFRHTAVSHGEIEEAYRKDLQLHLTRERIRRYRKELQQKLDSTGAVDYSAWFHELLIKEKGNINILSRLTALVMTSYNRDKMYKVETSEEKISNHQYPAISIWKTIIYRKK